jgi:hypothetical protein
MELFRSFSIAIDDDRVFRRNAAQGGRERGRGTERGKRGGAMKENMCLCSGGARLGMIRRRIFVEED